MLKRILIALALSAVATTIFLMGAAMADGMCHCMKSMFTMFPYGSYVNMHFSSDFFGLPLLLLQFPVYAVSLAVPQGWRWRLCVLILLIGLHVAAASFALHDHCGSRPRCFFPQAIQQISERA